MPEVIEKPSRRKADKAVVSEKSNGNGNGNGKVIADFDALLHKHAEGKVAIFAHRCPDPDAIGAMMGLSWLMLRKYNIEAKFFYTGDISHPQNSTMCNLLDPGLLRVEAYKADEYALRIVVDATPANAGTDGQDIPFDVVIDHHREIPVDYEGLFIHRKYGSASAIIYEIIKTLVNREELWFDDNVDFDQKVATALVAGVAVDTTFLCSDDSTEIDRLAFNDLFPFRNSKFLNEIVFFKRPKYWIEKRAIACVECQYEDEGIAIVGLGVIPDAHRDLVADIADYMLSWTSVQTAIAFAVVGGERIEGSVRSANPSLSVPEFCRRLGEEGTGGGKMNKGAYRVILSPKIDLDEEDEPDIKEAWESIKRRELKRIARVVKK